MFIYMIRNFLSFEQETVITYAIMCESGVGLLAWVAVAK